MKIWGLRIKHGLCMRKTNRSKTWKLAAQNVKSING